MRQRRRTGAQIAPIPVTPRHNLCVTLLLLRRLVHRTPCNACYELAKDIEALKFVLRQPSSNTQIIGDICEKLASSHMPYSWIESHCEDIMDEYSDDIVVALVERDRLKLSPFTSPVSKLLCQNMMGCARPPWESANEL